MTTLEEAPAQAAHQSERLWVRPRGPGSRQCLRRVSRPDSLRSEDSEGRMGRRGTFWPGARTSLPGSSVAPEGPQEGPLRPAFRAQNALKKHPCGAESRGGGGAPPTHLILLRNQRAHRTLRRAPARPSVRAVGGPAGEQAGLGCGMPRWDGWKVVAGRQVCSSKVSDWRWRSPHKKDVLAGAGLSSVAG